MKKKRIIVSAIISSLLMLLSIILFLSFKNNHIDWFVRIKNFNASFSLYPLLATSIGGFGSIVAGVLMQYTTRNQLASPFTMGILPSSSLAAIILRLLNIASLWLNLFIGLAFACVILIIVASFAHSKQKSEMIVMGLAIGMIIMVVNFLLAINLPDGNLVFRWFSRGTENFTIQRLEIFGPIILVVCLIALLFKTYTTIYYRSPEKAVTLGIRVKYLIFVNYFFAAIISVCSVLLIGEIAFIGIAIPNITRVILKNDNMLLNIIIGSIAAMPLLFLSLAIANSFLVSYQLVITIVATPCLLVALFLRRLHAK